MNERAKKSKGLSTPMAIVAIVLGFSILVPMLSILFVFFLE
ncbi:hypothetical protein AB3N04_06050 [Alkalihalophilus sp. As8PL]|uniref:Uncharacterized protein n=1 Tax=Alkalihalophilus sp. As8PL TaxID=3237103 RepID=A0AB39BW31_9BACI